MSVNIDIPSLHTSIRNRDISFVLGAGHIDAAVEEDLYILENSSDNCVINITSDNQTYQENKDLLYRDIIRFILSFF